MINYKFFAVLLALMLSFTGSGAEAYSIASVSDSVPTTEDLLKLKKIEQKLTRSPHYKNPNAAGRLAVINRTSSSSSSSSKKKQEQLSGPAYKNRRFTPSPVDSNTVAPAARPRLIGPHYKNRSARLRRSQ